MDANSWILPKKDNGSAVYYVVDTIRNALVERKLKNGDKLPSESELAEAMKVSRGTVREAMKILSSFGLVDIRRGNGTYISKTDENVSMDSVLFAFLLARPTGEQQMECRRYIERIVYKLAIENATEDDIAALERNYKTLLDHLAENNYGEETTKIDQEFHYLLGISTGNPMIARLYSYVMHFLHASLRSSHVKNKGEAARRVHEITIEAIKKRDLSMIDQIEYENLPSWMSDADPLYFE